MSVSVRSLLLVGLVLAALVIAYLLGGAGGGGSTAEAADEATPAPAEKHELTMTGTGDASAVPDQLSFALAVNLTRPDLADALDAANRAMSRVLASLKVHGVEKGDVQTTGLSMDPVYDYPNYGPPVLRGYHVSERARVLVDDLKDGGAAVTAAVAAGGNDVRVDDLQLLVGDTDAVMEKARDAAVAEARTKAEQYAAASGEDLGDVVTINEVRAKPLPTPVEQYADLGAALDRAASVPIRAGRDEASVTVRIVWDLA
ncbi:SIMPL domain-containing protein [Nocardioides sp. Root224]|uniref:SIMPL domain-containing protein n=1 Tax=Nocardioides sp. Root224 TaxID=1736495 RepID=UPI00138F2AC3|nr:SIMPL domain-containing protein [Nocardioides sp. Root224]